MSKEIALLKSNAVVEFTSEQLELIKSTVAKGATNDELKLFLYRCKNMGLDPLKPGMVHFVKYGSNPGSIVVGIDGFRAKADSTGLRSGTERGVIRDKDGKCIGAWCEVHRKDWTHPAREEVSLSEYNTGKAMWAKMPETMIKKVAEAAALRMAFPDHLSGMYSQEEMDQADRTPSPEKARQVNTLLAEPTEPEEPDFVTEAAAQGPSLGDYIIPIGKKYVGKKLSDLSRDTLSSFADWVDTNIQNKNEATLEFLNNARIYLEEAP